MSSSEVDQYTFDNPYNGGANIFIPSILKWRANAVMQKLKKQYDKPGSNIDFEKAEGFLNSFLNRDTKNEATGQRPAFAYCPKLTARPFWKPEDDPLIKQIHDALKQNESIIREEYVNTIKEKNIQALEIDSGKYFLEPNAWRNIHIEDLVGTNKQAQQDFPLTLQALSSFKERIFSAEFIVMEPDTTLPPHTDATNAYLVCHLGLQVEDNCGVQVDRQICEFHEGDIIFFDQSYPHSAWNKGSTSRSNLLITFFHPEITKEERELIQLFIQKLKAQVLLFSPLLLVEYGLMKLFSSSK